MSIKHSLGLLILGLTACEIPQVNVTAPQPIQPPVQVTTPPVAAITAPATPVVNCPTLMADFGPKRGQMTDLSIWSCKSQCDQVPFSIIMFHVVANPNSRYGWAQAIVQNATKQLGDYLLTDTEDHDPFQANGSILDLSTTYNGTPLGKYPVSLKCDQLIINGALFEFTKTMNGY